MEGTEGLLLDHPQVSAMGNSPRELGKGGALSRALVVAIGLIQACALILSTRRGGNLI